MELSRFFERIRGFDDKFHHGVGTPDVLVVRYVVKSPIDIFEHGLVERLVDLLPSNFLETNPPDVLFDVFKSLVELHGLFELVLPALRF